MRTHRDIASKTRPNPRLLTLLPLLPSVHLPPGRPRSNCQSSPSGEIPNPKPIKDFQQSPPAQALLQKPEKGSATCLRVLARPLRNPHSEFRTPPPLTKRSP